MQQLILEGKLAEAQKISEDHMEGRYTESYLPLCDITLEHRGIESDVANYRRSLTLDTGLSEASFISGGVRFTREAFVSHPDQAFVMRLSADKSGQISFRASLSSPVRNAVSVEDKTLIMDLRAPAHIVPSYVKESDPTTYGDKPDTMGMRARAGLKVIVTGGSVNYGDDDIIVTAADDAMLIFCARTSFAGFDKHPETQGVDEKSAVKKDLDATRKKDYQTMRSAHVEDMSALFSRVDFHLNIPREKDLSTGERLERFKKEQNDPALYELIFQYGRYLLIASSRPGSQAANLQGIWNQELRPPWSSNYTVNINTEMNYWPAEPCALSELHSPLFDLIDRLRVNGAKTAKIHYNADGAVCNHNTDLWAVTNPVGENTRGSAVYAIWPMAFGWLCQHLMEHYDYTLDKTFLKERALPAIADAAQFYIDTLRDNGKDSLSFFPATSPENSFMYKGDRLAVSRWSTMSNAITKEVFHNLLRIGEILGVETNLMKQVRETLPRIAPYQIGSQGQLLEWDEEYEEPEVHHRHISHLYPLHPGREFTLEKTPDMAQAVRRSLEIRGDEGTGWFLGWKISQWARLMEGDHALKLLKRQLKLVRSDGFNYMDGGGTYLNLFGAHLPFQIDGNFAASAGIAEMLLQNNNGKIVLLPALPKEWADGHMKGLRAFGGTEVDLYFSAGTLHHAEIRRWTGEDAPVTVEWNGKTKEIILRHGKSVTLQPEDFE